MPTSLHPEQSSSTTYKNERVLDLQTAKDIITLKAHSWGLSFHYRVTTHVYGGKKH